MIDLNTFHVLAQTLCAYRVMFKSLFIWYHSNLLSTKIR